MKQNDGVPPLWPQPKEGETITVISWSAKELAEFEELVDGVGSRSQLERISCRLDMNKFVAKHGKEKCDAMFAFILKRDGEVPS